MFADEALRPHETAAAVLGTDRRAAGNRRSNSSANISIRRGLAP
jgi:hypothetical protein